MNIQTEHMKRRCYFISAICGMSLYTWYNYSLFDPINNSFLTPYYQNCLFMLFYLGWDTYHIITNPVLYRTDLMINHCFTIVFGFSFTKIPLVGSNVLIMECISLMNYIWRNNPKLLKLYRTICVLCIRIPLSLWLLLYYSPNIIIPYYKPLNLHNIHYLYLSSLHLNGWIMYIIYDMFILWKLYNQKTKK